MSDSFFTARNEVDPQLEAHRATSQTCEKLLDASVRRLCKLDGPIETAVKVQRLADICAGVHVMPIDYWRTPDPVDEDEYVDRRSRVERAWHFLQDHWVAVALILLLGFFAGFGFARDAAAPPRLDQPGPGPNIPTVPN